MVNYICDVCLEVIRTREFNNRPNELAEIGWHLCPTCWNALTNKNFAELLERFNLSIAVREATLIPPVEEGVEG